MESVYAERRLRLRTVCQKYNLTWLNPETPRRTNQGTNCSSELCSMAVDLKQRLMACLLPKVGCTTLKNYFLRLLGNQTLVDQAPKDLDPFHRYADPLIHRVTPNFYEEHDLQDFFKFLFVRHPFERLVSAFVDKTKNGSQDFYQVYWIPIMNKYRNGNVSKDSKPTFREFVLYLLNLPSSAYTEHWAPYWRRCEPCALHYDFIGKLEHGQTDVPYALGHHPVEGKDQHSNKGSDTSQLTWELFSQLTQLEIRALYSRFRLDFELFGYSAEEYLLPVKRPAAS